MRSPVTTRIPSGAALVDYGPAFTRRTMPHTCWPAPHREYPSLSEAGRIRRVRRLLPRSWDSGVVTQT